MTRVTMRDFLRKAVDGLRVLRRDERGSFAVIAVLVCGMIIMLMYGTSQIMSVISKREELKNLVQTACARAIRPTRMQIYEDADRQAYAVKAFDSLAADRKIAIASRTITAGFLTTTVTATSTVPAIVAGFGAKTISASDTCKGVPPYPALADIILSSSFTRPDGTTLPMKNGTWGIYDAKDFGWDGGDGYGVEIQDWSKPATFGNLPAGSTNPYVVELDSDNGSHTSGNSSMWKLVELHKGTYEFSFWYYGRQDNVLTNRISVYLEGKLPISLPLLKLTVAEPKSSGWLKKSFQIDVDEYRIYKLIVKAEGIDDSYGGNFNDLQLKYVKRPNSTYND
ncbi:hypothetical protein [Methylopila sp. M107]|uniref:TadE/TadG family type IV pilus assembly protein n=1 Tax=Methylopila sp. M107 TaxID=1101190 RepID=UPI00036070EA|nr:hypothetical protein [Methylopila sp. M107]